MGYSKGRGNKEAYKSKHHYLKKKKVSNKQLNHRLFIIEKQGQTKHKASRRKKITEIRAEISKD